MSSTFLYVLFTIYNFFPVYLHLYAMYNECNIEYKNKNIV